MTRKIILVLAALVVTMPALAQTGTLKGKILDQQGKAMADVTLRLVGTESGRKYEIKTDNKGEYMHIAILSGAYNIDLVKEGRLIFQGSTVVRTGQETVYDIDLAKAAAAAQETPEQQAKREAIEKENVQIKKINAMMTQAVQLQQEGKYDEAANLMHQAADIDPTKAVVLARLGDAELIAAKKGNRAAAASRITAAADAYRKALAAPKQGPGALKPEVLPIVHTGLAEALMRGNQPQEAFAECDKVMQLPGGDAAMCYFNLGAVLTNSGKIDEANTAFDKTISVNPQYAEAYYQKGVNLMAKATINADGTMAAPPEVAINLNKYLELAPTGPNSEAARGLLASLGTKVETTFGKPKTKKK